MKATAAGRVIGMALESYNGEGTGKVLVFVNTSYADFSTGSGQVPSTLQSDSLPLSGQAISLAQQVLAQLTSHLKEALASLTGTIKAGGMWVFEGVTTFENVKGDSAAFENANMGNATMGSSDKPSGITLYDEASGKPYCLKISSGETVTKPGACAD